MQMYRQSQTIAADARHCPSLWSCERRVRRASGRTQKMMGGAAAVIVSRRVPVTPSPPYSILPLCTPGLTPLRHPTPLIPLSSPRFLKLPITSSCRRTPLGELHPRAALLRDAGATAAVMGGAYLLVRAFDFLTDGNVIEQKLSRKLVHVLSGLLFMASWPLFSTSAEARYFAAAVPLVNCLRLLIYGLSIASDEGLVKSLTREGKPEELLRGPLYYVLVLMFCTLIFWRESPAGVVSLGLMSGGDGLADIIGRRFGAIKLPYNQVKSWAGSICMFLFGFVISLGMLYYFVNLGFMQLDWEPTVKKVAIVSLAATLVESLPITRFVDDNISVPLTSIMMAAWFFSSGSSL